MKKGIIVLSVILAIAISGCSNAPKSLIKNGETPNEVTAVQSKDFYESIGMGGPSPEATSRAAKKQTSFEAANAAALKDMAAYLYGSKLESGITVQDAVSKNSTINVQVNSFIRGAEVVKREWDEEDGCIVTLRINLKEFQKKLKELGVK